MFVWFAGKRKISPVLLQGISAVHLLSEHFKKDYCQRAGDAEKASNQSLDNGNFEAEANKRA